MKKVLFLIHTLGGGGAEKVLVNLANNMDKTKFDVTVMTVINTGIFKESLDESVNYKYIFNVPKINFGKKKNNNNKSGSLLGKSSKIISFLGRVYSNMWKYMPVKFFYKIFITDLYDVEVAYLEGICAKIISGSKNKDSKKISWIHVDIINQRKSEFVFKNIQEEKKCYDTFNEIVCVSNVVKEQFIKKLDISCDKVSVKYNPIDSKEVISKSQESVLDLKKPNKFVFCSIGRLITQKGYDRLLKVHNDLINQGFPHELWIIGEGNKKVQLEQYITDNKLHGSVKLLGFKENPYKYLKMADAFVCSSRAEGFSTVASEATILGIPIVTVDCSGMKELLGNNNEYGLVTKNTEEDLLEGMKLYLENKKLYDHYSKQIKIRSNMFDLNELIKDIEGLCL